MYATIFAIHQMIFNSTVCTLKTFKCSFPLVTKYLVDIPIYIYMSSSYHTSKCIDKLHWHKKLSEISIENSGQP